MVGCSESGGRSERKGAANVYGELIVLSGSAHPELSREIAEYLGVPLAGIDIKDFPNENIFVKLHHSVRGQDVFLIQPMTSPVNRNIMELMIMIDMLKRASAGRINAVVPYYAYGRTDKKDQPRVPITARLIADMITVAGAHRVITVDLHAGQIQGFFNIPVDELTALHILSDYMNTKNIPDAVVVAADTGATKRARNFAQELHAPLAIIEKRRAGTVAEAITVIGNVECKNAIVFDDEIDTAGSMTQAVRILREHGVREVYGCVTHAVLSPPAVERLKASDIRELVVTNTVAVPPAKKLPNMTILSIASLMGEVMRRIHLGISVGEMFNE
jgi:ribose-phosphate pyrophosphokinase